jgi:hypothetical protein
MSGQGSDEIPSISILFLRLPIGVRNKIYTRVLTLPQPLYLFQDPGDPVETFSPGKPYQWRALLRTNRQISDEASAVLYGLNYFILQEVETVGSQGYLLKSLVNCIGSVNAGFLSRLRLGFPATERAEGEAGELRLREDGLQNLQLLQRECTGLRTLETVVDTQCSRSLIQGSLDGDVQDLRREIDVQFRAIGSLNMISVDVCSGSLPHQMKAFLQGLGWAVFGGGR